MSYEGRTILVRGDSIDTDGIDGIIKKKETRVKSQFIEFDTQENTNTAQALFTEKGHMVKYATYRLYVRFLAPCPITEDERDHLVRTIITGAIPDAKVLYFRSYKKNEKTLDCGELALDKHQHAEDLVQQTLTDENGLEIALYRYRSNRPANKTL